VNSRHEVVAVKRGASLTSMKVCFGIVGKEGHPVPCYRRKGSSVLPHV
jgi:hypothetical protein